MFFYCVVKMLTVNEYLKNNSHFEWKWSLFDTKQAISPSIMIVVIKFVAMRQNRHFKSDLTFD